MIHKNAGMHAFNNLHMYLKNVSYTQTFVFYISGLGKPQKKILH